MNIAEFCEQRLSPVAFAKIVERQTFTSLTDNAHLERQLECGDFNSVLETIWCERDVKKKLTWLRGKSDQLHPLLIYELAIAEFEDCPKWSTLHLISIPLVKVANFRTYQDCACLKVKKSVYENVSERFDKIYMACLSVLSLEKCKRNFDMLTTAQSKISDREIREMVRVAATCTLLLQPSRFNWLRFYGRSSFLDEIPAVANPKAKMDALAHKLIRMYTVNNDTDNAD